MKTYRPVPIETGSVTLNAEQQQLVERLAENAHDVWALSRIEDGWQYGPERNDAPKEHPCLIPYEALPESEKKIDRVMVESVLKAALSLGYTIGRSK